MTASFKQTLAEIHARHQALEAEIEKLTVENQRLRHKLTQFENWHTDNDSLIADLGVAEMDEQPLDRDAIRARAQQARPITKGAEILRDDVLALLDLLEQTERHLVEEGRAAGANFALLIQQRDKSREALKGSEQCRLLGEQRLAEVMAERDVARRERHDATLKLGEEVNRLTEKLQRSERLYDDRDSECDRLTAQVARLTEERDDARQDVESYRSEVFDLEARVLRLQTTSYTDKDA